LLECAVRLGEERALKAVSEGARQLRSQWEAKGRLHGRYNRQWKPTVPWRCLTGEAQTAIVWYRLGLLTGDSTWRSAGDGLTAGVCATQKTEGRPAIVGGVKGSYPVWGDYGQFEYLNWAAKFHADALMLKLGIADAGSLG
jgi:hypothetical protein